MSFDSSLSEVPRSYRGRNTNPDEHHKWLTDNGLRQLVKSEAGGTGDLESPKAFEHQWLERQGANGPILRACTPFRL